MSDNTNAQNRLALMIGMCARARKIVIGTDQICASLAERKKPTLVLVASDVSENTHKRLFDKCSFYGVRGYDIPLTASELAHSIGKKGSAVAAVAVTDEQMSRAVSPYLPESQN